ncbi:hypothetical protein RJB69_02745 [Staphylococcus hominis]|nr:hypothetical protein [Staphylococcus hominis]
MITKSIKYPYAKLTFDVLGILSSITFLILIAMLILKVMVLRR